MILIKKFFKDIYNKGNFKDYFKRNKLFFTISICLVILSFYTGLKHTPVNTSLMNVIISPINQNFVLNANGSIPFTFLFNMIYSLYTILIGLSFSILSILVVVANEIRIGNVFELKFIFYMMNDIFILVGAFLLTKIEIRSIATVLANDLSNLFSKIKVALKDLILTITLIIIISLVISVLAV